MAFESQQPLRDGTRVAGVDLSALQFTFVKLDAAGTVIPCAAATDVPYGVLQNAPRSGEEANVCIVGITKIVADATLDTPGTAIGTSADGQADAKTAGTDLTEYIVGTTISTAGAAGAIVTAVVNCAAPARAA